ncbi:MAG: hypothetical protein KJN96_08860, partial [Eudoraea sp.]|nr:hypothetical protein [Eudoraea sp.]
FTIQENSLLISYQLQNTGEKSIHTDEYVHNFLAINQAKISKDYVLKFLSISRKKDLKCSLILNSS